MATIGGYRDGILRAANRIAQQQEETKEAIANRKDEKWIFPKEDAKKSADYVVEWRSQKRKAQELIDSGEYSGEQLEKLKTIANGPDNPEISE